MWPGHTDWHLDVYGSGDREPYLRQARELGLTAAAVTLHPADDNIRSRYLEHGLYVLSSRFEGFGMVVIEAQACGLPVVAFDCPTGPAELIADGETGLLVPDGDVDALAVALDRAMTDDAWRLRASRAAVRHASAYSVDNIMTRWQQLFAQLLSPALEERLRIQTGS